MLVRCVNILERDTHPALWVLVGVVLLGQAEVGLPDLTLIVPEDKHKTRFNNAEIGTERGI